MVLSGVVQAGVYRWVDDNGRVHFGDRPSSDSAQELELKRPPRPRTGNIDQRQLDAERKAARQKLLDSFDEERRQQREATQQREAQERERQRNCAAARDRLRRYENASSLYQPLANGERRVLSKGERRSATEQARQAVNRWCE
jgi:hypothetical protein